MLDALFIAFHVVALGGWAALLLLRSRRGATIARAAGALLAAAYGALFALSWTQAGVLAEGYRLRSVGEFFSDPTLRLLGWTHILAFDLWVGAWIAEEARRIDMPRLAEGVSLSLTALLGPLGLLAFILLRAFKFPPAARLSKH
ncbi:MAG: abscisic acid-deficient protein Aba4 family protein [Phenylobacterium sp.]|uniref:abscisic acid-deficient protein Aba4 family protein n=1 Tax=Phenylobacterium sp. TaxID=1871053 RepID=UPI00391A1BC2